MKATKLALACLVMLSFTLEAEAGKKKKQSSNGAPTAEQKRAAWERGMVGCRKKYGARLDHVSVEKFYGKWEIVCYAY